MSYEGYSQFLCKNGHGWTSDCMNTGMSLEENKCFTCGEPAVWENMVNVTNGSFEGDERIDGYVELELLTEKKCEHCDSILERTYKQPKTKRET